MPTYEYQCDACGHGFELFQSMTESAKRKCPKCGKSKLQRLIGTGAGVLFKGSGFYETDYRSESYRKAAESEKKPSEAGKETKSPDAAAASTPAPAKSESAPSKRPKKAANEAKAKTD